MFTFDFQVFLNFLFPKIVILVSKDSAICEVTCIMAYTIYSVCGDNNQALLCL